MFLARALSNISRFCSLETKKLSFGDILGDLGEIMSKELSNALFRCAVALLVPE